MTSYTDCPDIRAALESTGMLVRPLAERKRPDTRGNAVEPLPSPTMEGLEMNAHADITTAPALTILELGKRIGEVHAAIEGAAKRASKARHADDPNAENFWRDREADGYTEYDALRKLIALRRASSIEECLIQVAEATSVVDMLRDQFPAESRDYLIRQDFAAVRRILYSVIDYLNSISEQPLSGLAHEYFGSPWCNPWRLETAEEVAQRREGGAA